MAPRNDPRPTNPDTPTESLAVQAAHSLRIGTVLCDRFRIAAFLGGGGMGEVYKAEDLEVGGTVALKILRSELFRDPVFLNRFRREVHLARQVTHPNICRIFDLGHHTEDNCEIVFLTMEYLEGETLASALLRRGRFPVTEAIPLIRQIADGLSALHEKGVVHRDFKPSNIMIVPTSTGSRAVIADFGLARAVKGSNELSPGPSATQSVHIVGTPDYMAPEQVLGEDPTPAADIYCFGLVLYELFTGTKPFPDSRGFENPVQRFTRQPARPSDHAPELSRQQESAILRCLAAVPGDRPRTAAEVVAALSGEAQSDAKAAPPRWIRVRSRIWIVAILACAVILGYFIRGRMPSAGRQLVTVLPFSVAADDPALRIFADGLMESITSQLSLYDSDSSRLLVVPARETIQQAVRTPAEARAKFGSGSVVQGSLQRQGQRIRLMLTVVDTHQSVQTDTVLVEDERTNALNLQDIAVERLATALKVHSRPRVSVNPLPIAPGAYDYQLQARGYLLRSDKLESLDSAIALFTRVIEGDSRYAPAYAGLGLAHWYKYKRNREEQMLEEALSACKKAIEIQPSLPDSQVTLGSIYLGTGRSEEAQKAFETALAADGRNTEALQGLAEAYYNLKQFDRAEATYRNAIALRPDDWNGYKSLGLFYYRRGNFEAAIDQYKKVVALTPDNAMGWVNLGAFQIRKGDTAAAKDSLHRALKLDPTRSSVLGNLAKIYFDDADYTRAIEFYQRATQTTPKDPKLWGSLGMAYIRRGDSVKARAALEKAVDLLKGELLVNPKRAELYSSLALYEASLHHAAPAQEALEKSIALAPEDNDIIIRGAESAAILGDSARALVLLRQVVQRGYPVARLRDSVPLRPLLDRINKP